MLISFKRGQEVRKSLKVGMIKIWPEIIDKIRKKDVSWNIDGFLDGYDDTYYISMNKNFYNSRNLHIKEIIIRINTETKGVWTQFLVNNKYTNKGEIIGKRKDNTEVFVLNDSGNTNDDIALNIHNQIKDISKKILEKNT